MTMTEANPRIPSKISIRWLWPDLCINIHSRFLETIEIFFPMVVQMLQKFKLFFFEHFVYIFRTRDVILYLHAVSETKTASTIQ